MDIQNLIINEIKDSSPLIFPVIFFGAALLSLTSCSLLRIPIALGFISGVSTSRKNSLFLLSGFIAGSVLTYTCLGVLLGIGSRLLLLNVNTTTWVYMTLGIFLAFFGLYLLGFIPKLKPSSKCMHHTHKSGKCTIFTSFLFGASFSFFEAPSCPCCGPVLLLIATTIFVTKNIIFSLLIFMTYALGQNLPMFLLGLSAGAWKFMTKKFIIREAYIISISGTLLFCMGIYLLWIA